MPAAARVGDPITHTSAFEDLIEGALIGAALGALLVASGGAAAPLMIAAAAAGGASLGGTVGKLWGKHQAAPAGKVAAGSRDVFINGKPAAFYTSLTVCDKDSGPQAVAEGSSTVFINGRPAARTGDHGACGFVIGPGSPDVVIGGPPVAPRGYADEVPWQADAALLLLGLAGGGVSLAVKGLGAAAIAARLGAGLVGGALGGGGAHYVGGKVLPEGSVGLDVVTLGGSLVGGGVGYGLAARSLPSPTTIAARRAAAIDFYRAQGFEDSRIASHLRGIDFTKRVDVVPLREGQTVGQWQVPGAPQGTYYARPGVEPTRLGINPQSQLRGTTTVVDRVPNAYRVTRDVQVLRSRAAPILDDWSVPGAPLRTRGGGTQYFTTSSSAFELQPPP